MVAAHWAAVNGKKDCLQLLIERGANVNAANEVSERGSLPNMAAEVS